MSLVLVGNCHGKKKLSVGGMNPYWMLGTTQCQFSFPLPSFISVVPVLSSMTVHLRARKLREAGGCF